MDVLKSEGKCIYCKEVVSEKEITKHLNAHLKKAESKTETHEAVHIAVEGGGGMFLNLLASHTCKLKDIDNFLQNIWLNCCGHMSEFDSGGKNSFAIDIFESKKKIGYQYDFGDTTYLNVKGVGMFSINQKEKIKLLSRNEPLKLMCRTCKKKPATEICTVHLYQTEESFFCKKCAAEHGKQCEDFLDYASLPVVNSPRMGLCGYTGGAIDLERDGVYKAKYRSDVVVK